MSCCDCANSPRAARAGYLTLMFLGAFAALMLKSNGDKLVVGRDVDTPFGTFNYTYGCSGENLEQCVGNAVVYRVSFSLAVFYFAMALLTTVVPSTHTRGWVVKVVSLVALMFGTFYISNDFFFAYSSAARWLSALFLVVQLIALIDMAYTLNERWVDAEAERSVLGLSCALYVASALGVVVFFWHYSCGLDLFFSFVTLIAICVFSYLSIVTEHGAILPSAMVAAYVTFLCWSALESNPDGHTCRGRVSGEDGEHDLTLGLLSALFASVSLAYTTYSASSTAMNAFHAGERSSESEREALHAPLTGEAPRGDEKTKKGKDPATADQGGDDEEAEAEEAAEEGRSAEIAATASPSSEQKPSERLWIFHAVMMCGAMYMSMILTAWGDEDSSASASDRGGEIHVDSGDKGRNSMWAKILSQWLTILLYIWTLVAPTLFPDRDFGV